MSRKANLPPCPNCGLPGGRYERLDAFSCPRLCARVSGFEIICDFCGARSHPETTKARVLTLWKNACVLSTFEEALINRDIAAIERELLEDRLTPKPPSRGIPDDDIPF